MFCEAKIVPKADEIKDASAFLRMRTSEKRACLRASGAFEVERKFRKRGGEMWISMMRRSLGEKEHKFMRVRVREGRR